MSNPKDQSLDISNESTRVQVTREVGQCGPRLKITDLGTGASTYLDPLELSGLCERPDREPLLARGWRVPDRGPEGPAKQPPPVAAGADVADPGEHMDIVNEFAHIRVTRETDGGEPCLKITDLEIDVSTRLDPQELSGLCEWTTREHLLAVSAPIYDALDDEVSSR